jgi:dCTP deaminase
VELLVKDKIVERLRTTGDKQLHIAPLLDDSQIGEVSIDLRVGTDFMVSVLTRKPYVGVVRIDGGFRGTESFLQHTRRELGDRFVLYPNQLALTCTLEYVALPTDVYADVLSRSSYTRLGIHINTMIQPGFRGCFPLELFNHGNNPIELVVGSRICQTRLFELNMPSTLHSPARKYFGNVRPVASRAPDDQDIGRLESIKEAR